MRKRLFQRSRGKRCSCRSCGIEICQQLLGEEYGSNLLTSFLFKKELTVCLTHHTSLLSCADPQCSQESTLAIVSSSNSIPKECMYERYSTYVVVLVHLETGKAEILLYYVLLCYHGVVPKCLRTP